MNLIDDVLLSSLTRIDLNNNRKYYLENENDCIFSCDTLCSTPAGLGALIFVNSNSDYDIKGEVQFDLKGLRLINSVPFNFEI